MVAEAVGRFAAGSSSVDDFLAAITKLGDVAILLGEAHTLYVYYVCIYA